jgi:hypothetical protein
VTLATARTFGWVIRKIAQPSVIGEILEGVVLGPTIFGRFAPDASAFGVRLHVSQPAATRRSVGRPSLGHQYFQ